MTRGTVLNRVFALLLILASQDPGAPEHLPDQPASQAHVGKGYEFEKDDRFANAAAEFEAALALDPNLSRARYQLAVCYFALGRNADAKREFVRLRAETHDDPSVVYFMGRLDLVEHDLEGAIREFQSLAARPPFPDTAYYLGSAYLEKGDLQSAAQWLKRAGPLNPRDFRIPDHLARIYQRQGHSADAEQEYARSTKLRQNYNQAAEDGVACSDALEKGRAEVARDACAKLARPDDPDLLTLLGMVYGRHGHYAEAVEPLRRAAALDPDSYEIEHNLGLTYFRLKLYQEARGPLERAVALRPDFFDSNALLGATLFALRQDSQAYNVLDHAHRLNPEDPDTRELLFQTASILGAKSHETKNYLEALKYLRAAEELKPQDPQVHARLAAVYAEAGDRRRADIEKQTAERLAAPQ
ncbi:MAG: tetratricopeptide repeat protein [Terriglobia bacterium]